MKKFNNFFKTALALVFVLATFSTQAQMVQLLNDFGLYEITADACGTNTASCTITIEKPVGATTVYKAYFYYTCTAGQADQGPNAITFSGGTVPPATYPITNLTNDPSPTNCYTRYEDYTALLSPGLNAAPAGGTTVYTIAEGTPSAIDGNGLIVVWNNPTVLNTAVHVSIGSRNTATIVTDSIFTAPINPTAPGFAAKMGMGFAFSTGTGSQIATVSLNNSVLTTNAGGLDDGDAFANGSLITLGGYQDNLSLATEDEYYDIAAFIPNNSTYVYYEVVTSTTHISDWFNAVYFEIVGVYASVSDTTYTICNGDSLLLGGLYQNTAGIYYDTLVNYLGLDSVISSTLVINPPITTTAVITDVSCFGLDDGQVVVTPSGGTSPYTYSWSLPAIGNSNTASNLFAGPITVTVTDSLGCTHDTTFTVNGPPLLTVNAGPDDIICIGGNTNITAIGAGGAGPYAYSWVTLPAGPTHNVAPAVITSYIVTVTDANGCTAEDTVVVDLHPPLDVAAGPNSAICIGGQTSITANVILPAGNGGPYTYTWDNALGAGQTHTVSPIVTTTYTVTLTDNCGTPAVTAQVTVTVNPNPVVAFAADTLSFCETPGQAFTFTNMTDTTGGMVGTALWNFGDGSTGSGDVISHTYSGPGTYNITLIVTSTLGAGGCSDTLTKVNYVEVYADPVADFIIDPNPASMMNPTVNFFDQSYFNIVSWNWDIGGLETSIMQNPTYTFPKDTGYYSVTLTVIDNHGCENTVTYVAVVKGAYGVYVPNAFTPGSDGLNDGFFPTGFGIDDKDYSFMIFNRWGEMIFESNELRGAWDGTYKGKLVQNGVYTWKLHFKDIDGVEHEEIGHVTILK